MNSLLVSVFIQRMSTMNLQATNNKNDFDTHTRKYIEAKRNKIKSHNQYVLENLYKKIIKRYTNGKHTYSVDSRTVATANMTHDYIVDRSGGKVTCKISKRHDILLAILGGGWTFYHVKFTF